MPISVHIFKLTTVAFIILGLTGVAIWNISKPASADIKRKNIPIVTNISPTTGPVGTKVIITGTGFSKTKNSINFAGKKNIAVVPSTDGRTITFSIPATPCSIDKICSQAVLPDGPYSLTLTTRNRTTKPVTFTVLSKQQSAYFTFHYPPRAAIFTILLNDPVKIAKAREIIAKKLSLHVSGIIVKSSASYNSKWSYHLEPSSISFFENAIEVCDSGIEYVEEHLSEVGTDFLPGSRWCPWGSQLLSEVTVSK